MKKIYTFLLSFFIMAIGATLFACGNDPTPKSYSITTEENELVDIRTDYQIAQEGTLITVTVEPNDPEVYVVNVYANEELCTKTGDNTYTFTLVTDTVVSAETETRYQEISQSEYASASVLNPTQIIKTSESYLQGWRPYLTYEFDEPILKGGNNLKTLTSSNQDVIKDESLTAEFFNSQQRDNGYVDGLNIYINTEEINYGETYIVIEFKEDQISSSPTCRLVKKIEIVSEDDYDYTANVFSETVNLDFSSVQTTINNFDYVGIMLSDDDNARVYGIDYNKLGISIEEGVNVYETQWTTAAVIYFIARDDMPEEISIYLGYLANHHYGLDVFGILGDDINDFNSRIYLSINERLENNNGSMYSEETLTFEKDNSSISLKVVAR